MLFLEGLMLGWSQNVSNCCKFRIDVYSPRQHFVSFRIRIISFFNISGEIKDAVFLEKHTMGGTTKLEMTNLLTLLHSIAWLHTSHTAWNLSHTNKHNRDMSNLLIVSFNDEDSSGWCACKERLRVYIFIISVRINDSWVLKVIATFNHVSSDNFSVNWRMPTMVRPWVQKSLISCSTLEHFSINISIMLTFLFIGIKNIKEGVFVIFKPKLILKIHIKHWHRRWY